MDFESQFAELRKRLDSLHGELRQQEAPPPYLFHYSTAAGIEGITKSRVLWASNSHFLNDASEPAHALGILARAIDSLKSTRPAGGAVHRALARFWDSAKAALDPAEPIPLGVALYPIKAPEVYVFCLSKDEDLLSQWRAYSEQGGGGYAIGFSSIKLQNLLRQDQGQYLVKVVYDKGEQLKQAEEELRRVVSLFADFENRCPPRDTRQENLLSNSFFYALISEVIRLQVKFKSDAWSEESEWRIVQFNHPDSSTAVHFRISGARLVPYVILDFKNPLPIEHATIGPTYEPQLAKQTLELLFTKRQYSVMVKNSTVPFRP